MSSTDDIAKNETRSTGVGPGELLQAARIKQGLALDDVAARMHLSSSILSAIEDNNFAEITAPIFVKGYLRAYARIVSLDEDEMILQYSSFYLEDDPPLTSTSSMAPELSVADARIKWTTYLVILVLGVLLVAWWWNKEQNHETPISLDTQSTVDEQAALDTDAMSSEIEAVSEDPAGSDEAVTATTSTLAPAEPLTPEPTVPSESAESPEVAEELEVHETLDTIEMVEPVVEEATDTNLETGFEEAPRNLPTGPLRLAPSGSDKLQIIVHADTWADIKDSNDFQLVYDLLRAENLVELTGQAPFSVFLGNGHGVEIMFQGKEIDIAPRVRDDNTVRLKIGN